MRPHNLSLLLVIALLLGVAACQTYQHEQSPAPSWNPPPLASPIIKSQQQLIVPPAVPGLRHYRLGIPLFRTPASVPEAGYPVTKIFYRQILEKGLFREVVFIERGFADLNEAISMGHEFKVDLMLLGAIPYFLDSGGAGKSGIQVDLQLREVKSRHIFWYLTDAITAAQRPIIDLWVTETRPYPTPGIYTLADTLAQRMVQGLQPAIIIAPDQAVSSQ